jgi:hypothetical protein
MSTFAARIRIHVQRELDAAAQAARSGDDDGAMRHLERAHVLGQGATREHVRIHVAMARIALRRLDLAATWGQAWRAAAALVFTPFGLLPVGNTGGSNVSAFRRMPIPHDLQELIDAARL